MIRSAGAVVAMVLGCCSAVVAQDMQDCKQCISQFLRSSDPEHSHCVQITSCEIVQVSISEKLTEEVYDTKTVTVDVDCRDSTVTFSKAVKQSISSNWSVSVSAGAEAKVTLLTIYELKANAALTTNFGKTSGEDNETTVTITSNFHCVQGKYEREAQLIKQMANVSYALQVKAKFVPGDFRNPHVVSFKHAETCFATQKPFIEEVSTQCDSATMLGQRAGHINVGPLKFVPDTGIDCCQKAPDQCCPGSK